MPLPAARQACEKPVSKLCPRLFLQAHPPKSQEQVISSLQVKNLSSGMLLDLGKVQTEVDMSEARMPILQ